MTSTATPGSAASSAPDAGEEKGLVGPSSTTYMLAERVFADLYQKVLWPLDDFVQQVAAMAVVTQCSTPAITDALRLVLDARRDVQTAFNLLTEERASGLRTRQRAEGGPDHALVDLPSFCEDADALIAANEARIDEQNKRVWARHTSRPKS